MKNACRFAAVSTEVAIGIALAAIVLITAIALFNDNLSNMVTNTKLSNVFNGNSDKTSYASYNRDYTNSQINVQIMGEQGLSMLRKRANNKAIELIEGPFSTSNTYGSTIAYLSEAIKIITGEPHICKYMKNESVKHCDEDNNGGYNYTIETAGSTLAISQIDSSGNIVKTVTPIAVDNTVSTAIGYINVPTDSTKHSSLLYKEQYDTIMNLTKAVLSYIKGDAVLLNVVSNFTTSSNSNVVAASNNLVDALKGLATKLTESAYNAYDNCYGYDEDDKREHSDHLQAWWDPGCWGSRIDKKDYEKITEWATTFNPTSTKPGDDFITSLSKYNIITRLDDDDVNDPSSCEIFKDGLNEINVKYNAGIVIPNCDND